MILPHSPLRAAHAWIRQDKHKQTAQKLRTGLERAFTEHPKTTGENYLQHLCFTLRMAVRFIYASVGIEDAHDLINDLAYALT